MFKILSIDGGGIKGVFPAAFLAELEKTFGCPTYRYFDLITGTSTGGIIALGLGLGLPAAEITEFYKEHGPKIFSKPKGKVGSFFGDKYSPDELRNALTKVFGEEKLGSSKVRLLIPSFNVTTGEIHIYKTRHHERFLTDFREKMVDVALATTAAPTYFPAHKGSGGAMYVDGGVWANNPVGNAVVEAISWLKQDAQSLQVLSVGCTQFPEQFEDLNGGKDWAFAFVQATLRAQSGGSLGVAYSLAGHDRVVRINPVAPPGKFDLDKTGGIEELATYGYLEARKASSDLKNKFFNQEAEQFSPLP